MKSLTYKVLAFAIALLCTLPAVAQLPYMDKKLSPAERADDLLGRLTLQEKASLMDFNSKAIPRLGIPAYNWWNEALHGDVRAYGAVQVVRDVICGQGRPCQLHDCL